MVPQKAFLFSGTLEDNLRDGKPDATQEELWEALSIAQAKEFVEKNERGLKMKISEGGTNFSGGQRQRLERPLLYGLFLLCTHDANSLSVGWEATIS